MKHFPTDTSTWSKILTPESAKKQIKIEQSKVLILQFMISTSRSTKLLYIHQTLCPEGMYFCFGKQMPTFRWPILIPIHHRHSTQLWPWEPNHATEKYWKMLHNCTDAQKCISLIFFLMLVSFFLSPLMKKGLACKNFLSNFKLKPKQKEKNGFSLP